MLMMLDAVRPVEHCTCPLLTMAELSTDPNRIPPNTLRWPGVGPVPMLVPICHLPQVACSRPQERTTPEGLAMSQDLRITL